MENNPITPPSETPVVDSPNTRRERREARRMEQRQQKQGQGRRRGVRRFMIWAGALLVIGGLGWGMVQLASDVRLPSDGAGLTVPVSDTDNFIGPADAKVTLVEYSDFQCPACAAFQPIVKQLLEEPEVKGKLKFVYRHFPLSQIHKNAITAGRAVQAAAAQGKFWEMHDAAFTNQQRWANLSNQGAKDAFKGYAQALSLDIARWERDIDSDAVKQKISDDYEGGVNANVTATPTFFLNGVKMAQPASYEAFKQTIINAITNAQN
jgi:protein-disulfide isomerase